MLDYYSELVLGCRFSANDISGQMRKKLVMDLYRLTKVDHSILISSIYHCWIKHPFSRYMVAFAVRMDTQILTDKFLLFGGLRTNGAVHSEHTSSSGTTE